MGGPPRRRGHRARGDRCGSDVTRGLPRRDACSDRGVEEALRLLGVAEYLWLGRGCAPRRPGTRRTTMGEPSTMRPDPSCRWADGLHRAPGPPDREVVRCRARWPQRRGTRPPHVEAGRAGPRWHWGSSIRIFGVFQLGQPPGSCEPETLPLRHVLDGATLVARLAAPRAQASHTTHGSYPGRRSLLGPACGWPWRRTPIPPDPTATSSPRPADAGRATGAPRTGT